jgi:hypothetical protein
MVCRRWIKKLSEKTKESRVKNLQKFLFNEASIKYCFTFDNKTWLNVEKTF